MGSPGGSNGEESACNAGDPGFILGWEDPLEKKMATHSSILGEFHGQRSLAGYSPWGLKELDKTEQLTHTHTLITGLGEGWNGASVPAFQVQILALHPLLARQALQAR